MLELAAELTAWWARGTAFAVATVAAVGGSAPRQPGAALAVDADGKAAGSVSGGCVEGAVYELCREVLADGEPVLRRFGHPDDEVFDAGLTCGGAVEVFVQRIDPAAPGDAWAAAALSAAAAGGSVAAARVVAGPEGRAAPARLLGRGLTVRPDGSYQGSLGDPRRDRAAAAHARALLAAGRTAAVRPGCGGDRFRLLVESSTPLPRMLVFGATDFASAVVRIGAYLGYRVTLCDARPVFATAARFPEADEVVVDWPHRYLAGQAGAVDGRTAVCVLTHDPKFDVPLLERALRLPVGYVGAMGSRRTHEDRLARLREAGLTEPELARLRSPIGLDLGARTPEETALSVAAEIVALRHGGSGTPLTGARTPIHGRPPARA